MMAKGFRNPRHWLAFFKVASVTLWLAVTPFSLDLPAGAGQTTSSDSAAVQTADL